MAKCSGCNGTGEAGGVKCPTLQRLRQAVAA